jgi:hypothetical protein
MQNMMFLKKIFTLLVVMICGITMSGCATTYHRGNGVVVSAKKIQDRDYKPHDVTKTGAAIGGATGAVGGAAAGGLVGLALGAFGNVAAPVLIATTLGGAVVGAIIVGGAGAAAGAGLGYVVDVGRPGMGLYQFVVKPDTEKKPIIVTQYSSTIPIDARVDILEKDSAVFIKQK